MRLFLDFGRMESNGNPVRRLRERGRISSQAKGPQITREYVLRQFWQTFVNDRFDLGNATQTKSVFPTLWKWWAKLKAGKKKKIGWVPHWQHACMWVYTAVICNGQGNTQEYLM